MSQIGVIDRELQRLSLYASAGYFIGLHIRSTTSLMRFRTYSDDWVAFYGDNGFPMRDPLVAWGFSTTGAVRWSEIDIPDPFGIFEQAASFGLVYGVAVSCGPIASRTIGGIARDDREFADEEIRAIEAIVVGLHDLTAAPHSLTEAQVKALHLIAAGNRYKAAAAKLGISESALKARLDSARRRLLARTTVEAIQRARDYRLM